MANTNKVNGFTPVQMLSGADWDGRGRMYFISKNDGNIFRVGDLVTPGATAANDDTSHGLPQITIGASGTVVLGSVLSVGVLYAGAYVDPNNLTLTYAPATKTQNYYALIADDPNIIFEAQESGTGTNFTAAHTSANCKMLVAAPPTGQNLSGWGLDIGTTPNTTTTFDLRLMGLVQKYDNGALNTFGKYAKWRCMILNHYYRTLTGVVAS